MWVVRPSTAARKPLSREGNHADSQQPVSRSVAPIPTRRQAENNGAKETAAVSLVVFKNDDRWMDGWMACRSITHETGVSVWGGGMYYMGDVQMVIALIPFRSVSPLSVSLTPSLASQPATH
uniref:Uncharacterized protein n=1 Tax=Vitrella brassicaformis TaxID=1169539 RepID=A0A6U4EST3_9ALVE|mmetsp:Transcript_27385/g.78821  ORF Transcript_27385/g.78821 Transcript_27385/m.78821 type:complete len:122 (+) Transcript_27385:108-473(+)